MKDADTLRTILLAMQETARAVAAEPPSDRISTAGRVSPSFLRQVNQVLREVNAVVPAADLGLFDEDTTPNLATHPKTIEVLQQIKLGLTLLDLSDKIGADMSEDEIKRVAQSPETGSMFNNAIFGDNVTILVGNNSQQKVHIEVARGDFNALAEFLKSNKVSEPDIQALKAAVEADATAPEIGERRFGPRVKFWLSSMFGKAVETAWQIEVGIAGGLLTSALQKYYGW